MIPKSRSRNRKSAVKKVHKPKRSNNGFCLVSSVAKVFKDFSGSIGFFMHNFLHFGLPMLFDFLLFIASVFLYTGFFDRLMQILIPVSTTDSLISNGINLGEAVNSMIAMQHAVFSIILLVIRYWVFFLFLWFIFQGCAWFFTGRVLHKKLSFKRFMVYFFLLSLFWWLFCGIVLFGATASYLGRFLSDFAVLSSSPGIMLNIAGYILIVLVFLCFISYALMSNGSRSVFKKTFSMMHYRRLPSLVFCLVLMGVFFFSVNLVLYALSYLPLIVYYVLGFALLLSSFSIARIFLIKSVED